MTKHSDEGDSSKAKRLSPILTSITDTTWRMFVPTLIGIFGGYKLDQKFDTLPWLFIIGTVLGCVLAAVLVTRQLRRLK